MSSVDIDLLEFASEWAPYGGNDAEAFMRFGLSAEEFHHRLNRLLGSPAARTLTNSTIAILREQCRKRLYRSSAGSTVETGEGGASLVRTETASASPIREGRM
ncbi:DUF3263 domain-containing protein [Nocardia sp. NPDC050713]|uniref:DUF3263 domain-containing protein n=1 Tax=Nocardia sp. NPDC050713 TaxID=3154511 RepID=UPI0033E707F3